jgi:hypothetical protein
MIHLRLSQNFSFWKATLDLEEKPGFSAVFSKPFPSNRRFEPPGFWEGIALQHKKNSGLFNFPAKFGDDALKYIRPCSKGFPNQRGDLFRPPVPGKTTPRAGREIIGRRRVRAESL